MKKDNEKEVLDNQAKILEKNEIKTDIVLKSLLIKSNEISKNKKKF